MITVKLYQIFMIIRVFKIFASLWNKFLTNWCSKYVYRDEAGAVQVHLQFLGKINLPSNSVASANKNWFLLPRSLIKNTTPYSWGLKYCTLLHAVLLCVPITGYLNIHVGYSKIFKEPLSEVQKILYNYFFKKIKY